LFNAGEAGHSNGPSTINEAQGNQQRVFEIMEMKKKKKHTILVVKSDWKRPYV